MADELMRLSQLPQIEERLRDVKAEWEATAAEKMSLVCTADTVQAVKAARADMTKLYSELEDQRKAVKAQYMERWNAFEATYKECITEPYRRADADLKRKIDETEGEIKQRCEDELQAYFGELCDAYNLPWLEYERAGVKVDLSSAKQKTPKKLLEQLKAFVEGVSASVKTIDALEDAAEILVEYKATLDAAGSIAAVQRRKKAAEEERKAAEERARISAERAEAERQTEAVPALVEAPKAVERAAVKTVTARFAVTDTVERLRLLKQFLVQNNFTFENI